MGPNISQGVIKRMDKRHTCRGGLAGKEYHLFHEFFSLLGFRVFYQQVPLRGK